jgi:hypothetical protein
MVATFLFFISVTILCIMLSGTIQYFCPIGNTIIRELPENPFITFSVLSGAYLIATCLIDSRL